MDQPCDQILSGATLTLDQDVRARTGRNLARALDCLLQRLAGPDQARVGWTPRRTKRRRLEVLIPPVQRSMNRHDEVLGASWQKHKRRKGVDIRRAQRHVL